MKRNRRFILRQTFAPVIPVLLVLALIALTARSTSAQYNLPRGTVLPVTDSANAAPPLNCSGSAGGFKLTIDTAHSSVSGSSVICNYVADTQGKFTSRSGFAVTVEYFCAKDTQAAWQSKTASQPPWQPGTNPNGEISRGGNSVLFREDGEVSGFAGTFTVAEKMFLLIDAQTIATIVVHTDVKMPDPPASGPAPNPDPKVLNLDATQVVGIAGAVAGAHHALVNDLICTGPTTVPTTGQQFPASKPVLATIKTIDTMEISIHPYSQFTPNPNAWQKRVGTNTELHYGDVFCFQGRGSVTLSWYDGSTVSFSDPNTIRYTGKNTYCLQIGVQRPEDIVSPGVIRQGARIAIDFVSDLPKLVRVVVEELTPVDPEVGGYDVVMAHKGTTYQFGRDSAKAEDIICTEEGIVTVQPRNTSLAPFDMQPGFQVRVSARAVSPVTPGCTPPSAAPVPQPDTTGAGMTLQAGRRTVVAGDTVLLPVWLVNADNLANLNFALTYDASVVQTAGDPVKGDLLDNTLFKANAGQPGAVLAGLAQTSPLRGTGTVVNIPFRATGQPGDVTDLLLTVTSINDPSGGKLNIELITGQIIIAGRDGRVPGDPGSTGGGVGPGPDDLQKGDCDGDGALTELDALCALEMSTQLRPSNPIMDVDNSGSVDSRDSVVILQKALGK